MRKLRQFADKQEDQAQKPQQKNSLACCAHDCPLTGTISSSTSGGNWLCWAHDRAEEAADWPWLTKGIHENRWLFNLASRIISISPYELEVLKAQEIISFLRAKGREDLCRQTIDGKQESRGSWGSRLRNAAYEAAMSQAGERKAA